MPQAPVSDHICQWSVGGWWNALREKKPERMKEGVVVVGGGFGGWRGVEMGKYHTLAFKETLNGGMLVSF